MEMGWNDMEQCSSRNGRSMTMEEINGWTKQLQKIINLHKVHPLDESIPRAPKGAPQPQRTRH